MKKSKAPPTRAHKRPAPKPALDDLEFPVAPGFRSATPGMDFPAVLDRIDETQRWLKPEYQRRRLECHGERGEFVL